MAIFKLKKFCATTRTLNFGLKLIQKNFQPISPLFPGLGFSVSQTSFRPFLHRPNHYGYMVIIIGCDDLFQDLFHEYSHLLFIDKIIWEYSWNKSWKYKILKIVTQTFGFFVNELVRGVTHSSQNDSQKNDVSEDHRRVSVSSIVDDDVFGERISKQKQHPFVLLYNVICHDRITVIYNRWQVINIAQAFLPVCGPLQAAF